MGSITCAVHCGICAFIPGVLGFLGLGLLNSSEAEWGFTIVTVAVATLAFGLGYRRHRDKKLATLFLVGTLALFTSRFIEENGHHHHEESAQPVAASLAPSISEADHHHEAIDLHLLGALVGISGGLFVAAAHLLNARAVACCNGTCETHGSVSA